MFLSSQVRKCVLPLIAVASFSILSVSPALANDPPRVSIDGVGNGSVLRLNNPVQFQGMAADPQGIRKMIGTLQHTDTKRFVGKSGESIKFKFDRSQSTRWTAQTFNLKRGQYTFRMRVEDRSNALTPLIEVNFYATGEEGGALASAPANNQRTTAGAPPQIAIQFPRNGAKLKEAAAFSGIAKDDQGVNGVIATIMNKSTGQFLNPNGRFAAAGQFKLRTVKGKNAQWSTPQVQLPPGDYLLSVKAIDTNGQEGQWAQSNFSIAAPARQTSNQAAAATTTTVAAGALAANGLAYCSNKGADADTCASSSSDPDGDGYGWENEKSCIVVTHCGSANSDPDGDGFGWENNRSCIVLNQASSSSFPACRQGAASDPDGDGYGWERNATCLVR